MKNEKMPKYKCELRQSIIKNINDNKNVFSLREIYKISDILQRRDDREKYKTLTDIEWISSSIISAVIRCDDAEKLRNIKSFVNAYLSDDKRKSSVLHRSQKKA